MNLRVAIIYHYDIPHVISQSCHQLFMKYYVVQNLSVILSISMRNILHRYIMIYFAIIKDLMNMYSKYCIF